MCIRDSIKRVKIVAINSETIKEKSQVERERIAADRLGAMTLSHDNYIRNRLAKKKIRTPYLSSIKGSAKSFHENNKEAKKFCSKVISNSYCISAGEPTTPFFGNTPKKQSRKINNSHETISSKNKESIKFIKDLVKQSKY